jgi:GDP-4-dehydro-6-deoxy-D-mannose reductase
MSAYLVDNKSNSDLEPYVRVLITGAAGFVGRHLSMKLRQAGAEMTCTDLPDHDVRNLPAMTELLRTHRPDVIYHLAAQSRVRDSRQRPHETWDINVGGTVSVLEAVRQALADCRVVVLSSASVYGTSHGDGLLREADLLRPLSPYASSKAAAELATQSYARDFGLSVTLARPFNLIGPMQSLDYVIPSLLARVNQAMADGCDRLVIESSDAVRDFVDVRDAVVALTEIAAHGQPGEIYNVCSGNGTRIAEVAELIIQIMGGELTVVAAPDPARNQDRSSIVGDPAKLLGVSAWRVSIPLDQTLTDLATRFLARM